MTKMQEEKLRIRTVYDFLEAKFGYFENESDKLKSFGIPVKATFSKIIKLFKKRVPGLSKEVQGMCVEIEVLYNNYRYFLSDNRYTIKPVKRQQFSRMLNALSLNKNHREIVIFRYGRRQTRYVFPLPLKKILLN